MKKETDTTRTLHSKLLFLVLIFAFLIIPNVSHAFTCHVVAGGGNWNAAGTWENCNSTIPQTGDDVVLDATSGNVAVNANTASLQSFTMTGYTGTLSGTSGINIRGLGGTTQNVIFDGTITWTGQLTIAPIGSSADINLTTNGKLLTTVNTAGSAADIVLQDNLSFAATRLATLSLGSNTFDMNGKTISGNSAINRLLVTSSIIGTQRTITRNGGAFANADFRDIDLEASYDCSVITGLCGNAGGNSADWTFTTATTTYWIGDSGNWSDTAEWSWGSGLAGSTTRVPLPQDTVVFDANSFSTTGFTVTAGGASGMPRLGKDITFATVGADNPTLAFASVGTTIYGSLTLSSGMTITGTSITNFEGRSASTLTSAGVSFGGQQVLVAVFGSTLTLQDAFTSTDVLSLTNGTLDANDFNVTVGFFVSSGAAISRTLVMGNGTWTVTSTGTVWNASTNASFIVTPESSTILISNTTATSKTFAGGGRTYATLNAAGDNIIVTGSNIFSNVKVNTAGFTNGLKFTSATTNIITSTLTSNGSLGRVAKLVAVTGGSAATIQIDSGIVCLEYMSIQDITASGSASFYAANSTSVSGNSGWSFSQCPLPNNAPRSGQMGSPNEKVRGGVKIRGGVKFR